MEGAVRGRRVLCFRARLAGVVPASSPRLFPLFLKLEGRRVLVVGAGPVAERKVFALLEAGARVCIVAPDATEVLQRAAAEGRVEWLPRPFEGGDVEGARLVFAATSDPEVQRTASLAAEERGIFVVAVDDPPNATAYSGAVVDRRPFLIAISSSGTAPALTRLLRDVVEEMLPNDDVVQKAERLRATWRQENRPMGDRFRELVRVLAGR
jgi:siroheme synthase-like protein